MSYNPLSFPSLPSQQTPHDPPSPVHITPSSTDGSETSSTEDDEEADLAEQEWQESLAQLALLFNLVLLPFAGKYFGRRFAYFSIYPPCSHRIILCILLAWLIPI